jgi:hypothetical protein
MGDSNGCSWICAPSHIAWRGTCIPSFKHIAGRSAPCVPGQRLQWSTTADDEAVCLPCIGTLSGAYQVWTSDPPFFTTCRADCIPSVSYRLNPNATDCAPCSNPQCNAGEYLSPCSVASDATCLPCDTVLSPESMLEYAGSGCQTQCVAGFFFESGVCIDCDMLPRCPLGKYRTRPCEPMCIDCAAVPNTTWTDDACSTKCAPGFIMLQQGCQLCDPSAMCQHGGECTLDSIICYALSLTSTPEKTAAVSNETIYYKTIIMGGVARPDLKYPTRAMRK